MVSAIRKSKVKEVPLSEVKDDLSRFPREAETQDVVITRHGKPAGVLIGFKSEDDWFDYRLEHDPRFIQRVERARASFKCGSRRQTRGRQVTVRSTARSKTDARKRRSALSLVLFNANVRPRHRI